MIYVLILITSQGYMVQPDITFDSKSACMAAGDEAVRNYESRANSLYYTCAGKKTQ